MPFRPRKRIAALCIALAVFAVCVPDGLPDTPLALLTEQWQLVPPPAAVVPGGDGQAAHEQLAACCSLLPSRAPPVA